MGINIQEKYITIKLSNGEISEVNISGFSDKILINVSSSGSISTIYSIKLSPLLCRNLNNLDDESTHEIVPLLGGNSNDYIARIYALQIASKVVQLDINETRNLIVGLGKFAKKNQNDVVEDSDRDNLKIILDAISECSIW